MTKRKQTKRSTAVLLHVSKKQKRHHGNNKLMQFICNGIENNSTIPSNHGNTTSEMDIDHDPSKFIFDKTKDGYAWVNRTKLSNGNHQARVCVVCDCFIDHKHVSLTRDQILKNAHRLSVDMLNKWNQNNGNHVDLPAVLVQQYQIVDIPGLLLSPRARREGDTFDACVTCSNSLKQNSKLTTPPKYAIANGFVIGYVPNITVMRKESGTVEVLQSGGDWLDDMMCASISPVRAFGYVFAYSAGAHQSIKGHYSFFDTNQTHVGAVFNHYRATGANPNIWCVMCGRMTPKQKEITRRRAKLDVEVFIALKTWFIRESGHPAFVNDVVPDECPQPVVLEDKATEHNTDIEVDPIKEQHFEGGSFYFSSASAPTVTSTGTFDSSGEFAMAMLNNTTPTALVYGGHYANQREILLQDLMVVQFPFGRGGPKDTRPTHVSMEAALSHYLRLSLSQFMRGDFILVVCHMMTRLQSFASGIVKAKSTFKGVNLAERVSTLTPEDIKKAAQYKQLKHGHEPSPGGEFLKAVTTCCKSIAYSPEAAMFNRRNYFALADHFGLAGTFFVTVSPCDECSFRVRLFALAGIEVCLYSQSLLFGLSV